MVKLFSKNSNLCDHNSPTSQTDRQTDDRNTAFCTKVHRAVKTDGCNSRRVRMLNREDVDTLSIDVDLILSNYNREWLCFKLPLIFRPKKDIFESNNLHRLSKKQHITFSTISSLNFNRI